MNLDSFFNFNKLKKTDWDQISQNEIKEKLIFYKKLNKSSPNNQDILLNLALLSYYHEDYNEFKQYYHQLKAINPNRDYLK